MSLARALDHNIGRHISSSPELVTHGVDSFVEEQSEPELPVTSETNTRYISDFLLTSCDSCIVLAFLFCCFL